MAIYQQLGPFQSPSDWNWVVMAEECHETSARFLRYGYTLGTVTRAWTEEDERIMEAGSEWVMPSVPAEALRRSS